MEYQIYDTETKQLVIILVGMEYLIYDTETKQLCNHSCKLRQLSYLINTTGATSGGGTANPSRAPMFTPGF
jgi:hypothetical protein